MKVTINIPTEKIKAYCELYKLTAKPEELPGDFDKAVELALGKEEYELDLTCIEEGKQIEFGIAIFMAAQEGLKMNAD